ncbi:MAG: SAM-dependent DNA methyltransferase [Candidatus Methanomethylophilaceae archaeon]|nr:SAM-dependent DNA methyltransferase [Candidatus Methanomethylophilaceae archaeon]
MSKITIPELEKYLWDGAVILRGKMGAGSYKNYLFPLIFYKRICDVYDEEYKAAMDESEGDEEYAAMQDNHRFVIPPEAHWNVIRNTSTDVGIAISNALKKIESANRDLFGIFGDAAWTNKSRLPDELLKDLVEHLSSVTLSNEACPADELGLGYEYLVGRFADDSGHTAQEFYTNRTVVQLMTELLQPKPGESIYDPTCGSAGMLISSVAYLRDHGQEWRSVKLYGQELSPLTASIGKMNLFLHDIREFKIIQGDTLQNPYFIQNDKLQTFDIVLANPPYSIKEWDREKFKNDPFGRNFLGLPPQGKADFAFFQHILKSLSPKTGRCAILFPHGILFREDENELRSQLVKSDLIECVIGVSKGLFYNSPMEACIVICRTNKPSYLRNKIKLIQAKNYYVRNGKHNDLNDEHIQIIKHAYESTVDIPGVVAIVDNSEVLANESKMLISMYVHSFNDCKDSISDCFEEWKESSATLYSTFGNMHTKM